MKRKNANKVVWLIQTLEKDNKWYVLDSIIYPNRAEARRALKAWRDFGSQLMVFEGSVKSRVTRYEASG